MKAISLKTKIAVMLIAGLTLVFAVIVTINNSRQQAATTDLFDRNLEDQQWALNNQIELLMLTAENDRLQPLVETMAARGMVEELEIIDSEKKIARASNRTQVDRQSSDPVWAALFKSGADSTLFRTVDGEEFEYTYTILHNETACQDCHDQSEAILGGVKTVSSRQVLAETLDGTFWTNIWVSGIGGLILIVGLIAVLYYTIFRPLESVQSKLAAAAEGDTTQDVTTDRHDEIGSLMQAIHKLIAYIRDYAGVADQVAAGDLTADIPVRSQRDQLGQAFTDMSSSLDRMIKDLRANAGEMVAAAGTTASSAEQMSRNSSQQTSQIEQISTGIEEMVSTIHSSSEHAQTANDIAGRASRKATEGRQIVTATVTGMQAIRDIVQQTARSVTELSKSAEDIGTVTQVIDDIADQTNLLALNAAIEAARAGEQGRGFAVVADEVRKLADQTRKATQEIAEQIQGIQEKTTGAVHEMEDGIIKVASGTEQAEKAGESLEEIVILAEQVSGMIAQIASSTEEQNAVAQDIARSMTNVSNAAREFASGATESAGVAEQLNGQADALQTMVKRFKVRS